MALAGGFLALVVAKYLDNIIKKQHFLK